MIDCWDDSVVLVEDCEDHGEGSWRDVVDSGAVEQQHECENKEHGDAEGD